MDSKKIPTKKKQEIVEISKNLINEKGVNNVSIRDIDKKRWNGPRTILLLL